MTVTIVWVYGVVCVLVVICARSSLLLHTHSPLKTVYCIPAERMTTFHNSWNNNNNNNMEGGMMDDTVFDGVLWEGKHSYVVSKRRKNRSIYMGLLVGINIGRDFSPSIQRTYTIGWNWGEQGYHHKYEEKISKMNPCLDSLWWNVWWCVIDQDTGQMVIVSLSSGKTTLCDSFRWCCFQTDGLLPLARHGGELRPLHLVMSHTGYR